MQIMVKAVEATPPLVVDLDESLVRTDILYESLFSSLAGDLRSGWDALRAFMRGGKAALKAQLARTSTIDYATLPYNDAVLDLIRQAKAEGRLVYLATASDRRHADGVAAHLGLFDGVFASDGQTNLSGPAKAEKLVQEFGSNGFDYVGNSKADLPAWRVARRCYAVGATKSVIGKIDSAGLTVEHLERRKFSLRAWIKAFRVHQYAKNALIFVPMLTAHVYTWEAIWRSGWTFVAFSLCASSVYIINDLLDLESDRKHPTKRKRALASGALPIPAMAFVVPVVLLSSFSIAYAMSLEVLGVLVTYFALTLAYSVKLKQKMMLDVVVLAALYATRVIAGAVAIDVVVSEWLLIFCILMFTCLALVKRYVELAVRIDMDMPDPSNRNYRLTDLPVVGALAAGAGFNAITVFALYVSSPAVSALYRNPKILWLICPILVFWLGRLLLMAQRRIVDDDPIIFALRDSISHIAGLCILGIVLAAS